VCTGNICRSVMAEAFLRADLGDSPVAVSSAGLAKDGVAPPRRVVAEMHKRGVDVTTHRSRHLTPSLVEESSLVIGAARSHAWEAVAMVPDAIDHTFTFKELVRLGDRFGWRDARETFAGWLSRMQEGRQSSLPVHVGDDIVDPIGGSRRTYARVAGELEDLTRKLAPSLAMPAPSCDLPPLEWRASPASSSADQIPETG
jgi:protein-tyrosine phosphatase